MSHKRVILAAVLGVGMIAAACAPASVEEDVAALNERIDAMEQQIQTLQRSGAGSEALEQEAKKSITALNQMVAMGQIDEAKAKLKTYGTKYATTKAGRQFVQLGKELNLIGKACPSEWGIEKWYQGQNAIDLGSDATTVVVFWETWCPHCRREVPKLQELYDKFKGDGLQLIGVTRLNRKQPEAEVTDFIAQNNVGYPMAKEDGSLANYFAVAGIPAAAVVKDGKVVWRGHPVRINEQMIEGWLGS